MISTKIYTTESFPVPNTWLFEKLLNLSEPLQGQTVRLKSIFNAKDKNPSFLLYVNVAGVYRFNDFSVGISGDAVELTQILFELPTRQDAFRKAKELYDSNETPVTERTFAKQEHVISDYKTRDWFKHDAEYWTSFKISSQTLAFYNIKPLSSYTMVITQGSSVRECTFEKGYCYGYFTAKGELYKIYNPKDKASKFIKVKSYIQGHDQLQYKAQWLMILSSLKDIAAFKELSFPIETVAPESENVTMPEKYINFYKAKYKFITVMFDNDAAGIKNTKLYNELYGLPGIYFNVEKDIADCNKEHGIVNTRLFMKPLLIQAKNGKNN